MSPISPATPQVLGSTFASAAQGKGGLVAAEGAGGSFKDLLVDSIENVNRMQSDADQAVEALFTGGDVNPAEVLTAVQKADMAFRLTMQVRNKLMDVYREIQDVRV